MKFKLFFQEWRSYKTKSTEVELNKLIICLSLLKEIFGEASVIMSWLEYPHPNLNNKKPREVMVDGEIDLVIKELERVKNSDLS